jgi:hypothetical protein
MKLFERIEDALQKCNRYNWAEKLQRFEAHFVSYERDKAQREWMNKQSNEYENCLSLIQREIYLQEELSALIKLQTFTEDEKESIKRLQEELETFDERFWLHQRALYKNLVDKPKGPRIRWWYMSGEDFFFYSEKRKLECKAKGGCCEYDCGCCRRPLKTIRGSWTGYCTMECGCCIRRRGFYKPKSPSRKIKGMTI